MLTLSNINQATPAYSLLLDALHKKFPDYDLEGLIETIKGFMNNELTQKEKKIISTLLDSLGIKAEADELKKIYGHWQTFTAPISAFTELKEWSVDWDTSKAISGSGDVNLKLSAAADTRIQVWNKQAASTELLDIPESDVIVNHEVTAGYTATGSAAFSSGYATASIGIDHAREIEFDRFFQYPADKPTYSVLLDAFDDALLVWDLKQVNKALAPCANGSHCQGLRQLSLRTHGKFAFNGALGFGHAWSKTGDGHFADVSAGLNLTAGLSKTFEHTGNIHIEISKPSGVNPAGIRATVKLTDTTTESLSLKINANAEVKGLDQVARKYIVPLLGDADELVAKLEEWSSPADKLMQEVTDEVQAQWYGELVKLVFGESSSNQVYNQLVSTELKKIIDRYAQDPKADSRVLANRVTSKLAETFELDISDASIASIANTLTTELTAQFDSWKSKLDAEIDQFISQQQGKITDALAPLERLGVNVKALAGQTDAAINDRVQYAISQYQEFKETVLKALEKSANIQVGLALAFEQSSTTFNQNALIIDFIDSQHPLSNSLYSALILGKNKQFALLLDEAQQEGVISVPQDSINARYSTARSLSFNLDFAGISLSYVKNINTQLDLAVDNLGNIKLKGKVEANSTFSNFFNKETRQASMALSYDLANASIDKEQFASFAFHYSNIDRKKHSKGEMEKLLRSLTLPDSDINIVSEPMADIVDADDIRSHLDWYQSQLSTSKFTTSTLDVFVGDSKLLIEVLNQAVPKYAFTLAMDRVLELGNSTETKNALTLAHAYRDAVDRSMSLAESLNQLGDETGMDNRDVRRIVKKSKRYGRDFDRATDKAFDKYVKPAKRLYLKANAMEELIVILQQVLGRIDQIKSYGLPPSELEEQLSQLLQDVNERLGDSLGAWTEVNGVFMDWLNGGIDKSLVAFLSILFSLAGTPKGFIRVTLTLSDANDNKVIRVIS
ncbi:hypothetical protein L2725_01285 [Shewanella corallii]|uniref:Uncharacterized protein n=1 Tax=Shewanella corallii TaxID=560080 RepID=A0ABT0N1X2_9GAMM|nr:hypothetical protein [Shewanella corallii]MCL2912426.1 hypothetical protein [Shewanella corallii]